MTTSIPHWVVIFGNQLISLAYLPRFFFQIVGTAKLQITTCHKYSKP